MGSSNWRRATCARPSDHVTSTGRGTVHRPFRFCACQVRRPTPSPSSSRPTPHIGKPSSDSTRPPSAKNASTPAPDTEISSGSTCQGVSASRTTSGGAGGDAAALTPMGRATASTAWRPASQKRGASPGIGRRIRCSPCGSTGSGRRNLDRLEQRLLWQGAISSYRHRPGGGGARNDHSAECSATAPARSSAYTGSVSGLSPCQTWKASAACSTSMPRPSSAVSHPTDRAQLRKAMAASP